MKIQNRSTLTKPPNCPTHQDHLCFVLMLVKLVTIFILFFVQQCLSKDLDLIKLDYPWGKNTYEVERICGTISDPIGSFDELWYSYASDIHRMGTAQVNVRFGFYNEALLDITVRYDDSLSSFMLKQIKQIYGNPIEYRELEWFDPTEYYWFPNSEIYIKFSVTGSSFKIISMSQFIRKLDIKRDKRKAYAKTKNIYDVRGCIWGITEDEVKRIDNINIDNEFIIDNIKYYSVKDYLFDADVNVLYGFVMSRLVRVYMIFDLHYANINKYIAKYLTIKNQFKVKYGEPRLYVPEQLKYDLIAPDDFEKLSYIECSWEYNPKIHDSWPYQSYTKIGLRLNCDDDSSVTIGASYEGGTYGELIKINNLRSEMDKY